MTCPRGCDVATAPESVQGKPWRRVCTACGYEFSVEPPEPESCSGSLAGRVPVGGREPHQAKAAPRGFYQGER